jgi:hypothetical protein
MGAFDDAIREHLELKRKLGASEQELKEKEEEALGRGPRRPPPPSQSEPASESPEESPESARALAEPEESAPELSKEEPAPIADLDDELEPDEVPPVEALEQSIEEDVLEETPDFLEKSPEQDRLWFEQRAPKDFDFGD